MMEEGKRWHGMCCDGMRGCKCMHHNVKAVLVVLLGATIVAWGSGYLEFEMASVMAGGFIILTGLQKIFAGMCKCC